MKNVKMTVNGTKLVIEIDLSKNLGVSKTGKSEMIASTQGNISIPSNPEIKIGLNVYKST